MLDAKTIQKYKTWKLQKLIDLAQFYVNAYVRKRDQINEYGDFKCISCGKIKPKANCDAGHFFSKKNYASVRFDLDNIHGECDYCNGFNHDHLILYQQNLIKKIGQEKFDKLEAMAYLKNFKHDRFVIMDIIERFKNL